MYNLILLFRTFIFKEEICVFLHINKLDKHFVSNNKLNYIWFDLNLINQRINFLFAICMLIDKCKLGLTYFSRIQENQRHT